MRATVLSSSQAFNEDEEAEHALRWDGITPLLAVDAAAAAVEEKAEEAAEAAALSEAAAAKEAKAALEEAQPVPSSAGEGGRRDRRRDRRLADVTGRFSSSEERAASWLPFEEKAASSSSSSGSSSAVETSSFSVEATNSYSRKTNGYSSEYPWQVIAEPYRTTTLSAVESDTTASAGATYRWTVDGHLHGYGASVDVSFSEIGYHIVAVERLMPIASSSSSSSSSTTTSFVATPSKASAASASKASASSASSSSSLSVSELAAHRLALSMAAGSAKVVAKVMCKYVRREVRSLLDADREAWFSAVQVLQHVPTSAGQELYGSKYFSKDHFTRLHLYYGGALDCDHWHQGAGFVTSHVALTLMWEQALQSVNPSIAAPYWDFTVESTFYGSSDWHTSFIFSDDWFGDPSPDNELHTVVDGRWSFNYALSDASEFSDWVNSYGVMRAPWNNDPTPFLTRAGKLYGYDNNIKPSGCAEYYRALKKTTWMAMSKQLNAAAHGHIHELMGGAWGHYFHTKINGTTAPAVYTFAHQIQALSKMLWREGYVTCPDTCAMADAAADCQCTCNAESLKGKTSMEILFEVNILSAAQFFDKDFHSIEPDSFLDEDGQPKETLDGMTTEESKHVYNSLLSFLCNPGHLGDMYQATSTNDITFWVIHNTVDRLWHYKRLGNLANYDETWDPFHTCYGHNPRNLQPFKNLFEETSSADSEDSSAAAGSNSATSSSGNGGATSTKSSSSSAHVSSGASHSRHLTANVTGGGDGVSGIAPAQTMSGSATSNFKTTADKYYSNEELYSALHPESRKLQYMYDNFKWPHCEKEGYKLTNEW